MKDKLWDKVMWLSYVTLLELYELRFPITQENELINQNRAGNSHKKQSFYTVVRAHSAAAANWASLEFYKLIA